MNPAIARLPEAHMLGAGREFARLHLSSTMTLQERADSASWVINSLRFWRNHIAADSALTLKDNFITRQTFEHVTLQCHSAMLHIQAQAHLLLDKPVALNRTS